ncbi:MAG: hypothetical protein ABW136_12475 [Steroidobacteraceae bacterium]
MGRLLTLVGLLAFATFARAEVDFDATLDLRGVTSDGQRSFLNGGLGKLRFDPDHDGLRLGQLRLAARGPLTDTIGFTVEATAWGDHDDSSIDLIEAVLDWRPVPSSLWRSEVRLGAFYAPISLENRMRGWRSPYTISPSAINTWIGEELRTIGAEYNLDWLGALEGYGFSAGITGAVYGWNDPAGIVLALRGWSINDRQTTLFGKVGQPRQGLVDGRTVFYDDIDKRFGVYGGGSLKWRGILEVRALRYDNRGDPSIRAPEIRDWQWDTRFNSVGVRWTPDPHWTVIWQGMKGITEAQSPINSWRFQSQFLLGSYTRGPHRVSLRADEFSTEHYHSTFGAFNSDDGSAWTAAYGYEFSPRFSVMVESLWIRSRLPFRALFNSPVAASERQLQLAFRVDL